MKPCDVEIVMRVRTDFKKKVLEDMTSWKTILPLFHLYGITFDILQIQANV
jgi:hypothetical protein